MTESQNKNLRIIKARVEQDKYAAVELKIIKANGGSVLKDLYVEKELNNGEFFVASDNVLVTLHRNLKNGVLPNFELITKDGEVLMRPEYKEINQVDNNLFIAVKSVSEMISVKNNQSLRTETSKAQEIAQDSKNIKDQMVSTMKGTNPNYKGDLNFLYEDAYNEAILYRIKKNGNEYAVDILADKVSFIATDGEYIYTHSNIVPDLTKSQKINGDINKEELVTLKFGEIDNSISLYEKYAPSKNIVLNVTDSIKTNPTSNLSVKPIENDPPVTIPISDVKIDRVVLPDYKKNVLEKEERKESKADVYSVNNITSSPSTNMTSEDNDGGTSQVFDDFFGVSSDIMDREIDINYDSSENDRYEQLSDMISKVISEEKSSKAKIINYEEKIKDLENRISKANAEIESKTKKVNILINQNRQLGDDNRTLKNRVNGLENKTERLEEENKKYLQENNRLKSEAKSRENKLTAMISSVSELLGSYHDTDSSYAVKKKVA